MRSALISSLLDIAERDTRIVLLTGDLGFSFLEPFANKFPDRFYNVGVAEQNMIGIASGLAANGFIPFVYSIAAFAVLRPLEFIRNGPIFHHLPVRIIGVGSGVDYSLNGITHFAMEDIAVLRSQPNINIFTPGSPEQLSFSIKENWEDPAPAYYRISRNYVDNPNMSLPSQFQLGKPLTLKGGERILLATFGCMWQSTMEVAKILSQNDIEAEVLFFPTLNPCNENELRETLGRFSLVASIESHYRTGGLGSLIAEALSSTPNSSALERFGLDQTFDSGLGDQDYLHTIAGMHPQTIAETIISRTKELGIIY